MVLYLHHKVHEGKELFELPQLVDGEIRLVQIEPALAH
jgi:hypothetical protein